MTRQTAMKNYKSCHKHVSQQGHIISNVINQNVASFLRVKIITAITSFAHYYLQQCSLAIYPFIRNAHFLISLPEMKMQNKCTAQW